MTDCNSQEMAAHHSDGLSIETAIIIQAETIWSSVCEEYDYLSHQYGPKWRDWTVQIQDCLSNNGRYYDLIEIHPNDGEPQTYYFDVTSGYEDGLNDVSIKQGLMETRRHPGMYFQVRLDGAATARVLRDPEGEAMWAEVFTLAHQHFERKKARFILADALVMTRTLLRK